MDEIDSEIPEANLQNSLDNDINDKKKRSRKPSRQFPSHTFKNALELAEAVQKYASGKGTRKVVLFDAIGKAPDSQSSRDWITSANKYGLVKNSYANEMIELTEQGYIASSDDVPQHEKVLARADLAVMKVPLFKALYEEFCGNKLPVRAILIDNAKNMQIPQEQLDEAIDIFLDNVRFVGLLPILAGAERLIKLEHLVENISKDISSTRPTEEELPVIEVTKASTKSPNIAVRQEMFDNTCFYITPIGTELSEHRQHANLFLEHLIRPALQGTDLKVIRADLIDKPGVITRQIIEYILRSRLVIADLSFHNPNVFYELALRHATKLPTVHIVRSSDGIPFDVNQSRTISIDCSSIYTLVPRLDTYRAEIANQVRQALEDPDNVDNPISTFYPTFKVHI